MSRIPNTSVSTLPKSPLFAAESAATYDKSAALSAEVGLHKLPPGQKGMGAGGRLVCMR